MIEFAHIVMIAWIPLVIGLFAVMPARRAVIASFLCAWLFLPMIGYDLPGLPDYTKMSATCVGVLLGVALFDGARLLSFRARLIDLPMAAWCLCPFASAISNGLGAYEGISAVLANAITWGLPYLIGRLYFSDQAGLRELAIGIFIGGLIYVPLCLFEIRMSPKLHQMVYGFHQHSFGQTLRFGGWRPTVFMQHGLMVGMWMAAAALIGLWLWMTGAVKRLWNIPISWLVLGLLATTVACKSTGAVALLVIGAAALLAAGKLKTLLPVLCLLAVPPAYMALRASGAWTGESAVALVSDAVGADRAQSLDTRFRNETMLADKALRRPVFGWGRFGRSRVYDRTGEDISVTDGLWIITLGESGLAGLAAFTAIFLVPPVVLLRRVPARRWGSAAGAPIVAFCMLAIIYTIDNLLNGMVNPIFTLAVGGLSGVVMMARARTVAVRQPVRSRRVAPAMMNEVT